MIDLIIRFINDNESIVVPLLGALILLFLMYLPDIMVSLFGGDVNEEKEKE